MGPLAEWMRRAWCWPLLDTLGQDLRYGARSLVRNRAFAATAVLSLALGIGANTTIFSLINAALLRPLPVEDPDRLVQILRGGGGSLTNPIWEYVRDHQDVFSGVAAFGQERFQLSGAGESQFASGLWVSGDFFRLLGVPAAQGRTFTREDDRRGGGASGPVVVLSARFARRLFPGDPHVVGKTVRLNEVPFDIVGVTPQWFNGLPADQGFDVAIPIANEPLIRPGASFLDQRSTWWLTLLGRLRPGDSVDQASRRLAPLSVETFRATIPQNWDPAGRARFTSFRFGLGKLGTVTGQQYQTTLPVLMGMVGLLLLIACANIANLLLARAAARQNELSLRTAVGAGRGRLVRQLMTESLLIAAAGAVAGFVMAQWGSATLVRLIQTSGSPLAIDVTPDFRVFAFTLGVTLLTVILFGLAPALRSTAGLSAALKRDARGTVRGAARFDFGKALVLGQVALSLVLLVAATLFVGTFRNLMAIDLGIRADKLLLVSTDLGQAQIPVERQALLRRQILERLRAVPAVVAASYSFRRPISSWTWNQRVEPEGNYPPQGENVLTFLDSVTPGFFQTMGTSLLRGRDFDERDNLSSPRVTVIGESAARAYFAGDDPIGKWIRMSNEPYQVIGVVGNAKYNEVSEPDRLRAYFAALQGFPPMGQVVFGLRSAVPVEGLTASVRAALSDVAPNLAFEIQPMEGQLSESLLPVRLVALLASVFGALALLTAMVGLYGVTSYAVARRRSEIGIRRALGAQQGAVLWMVLRDVLWLLAGGAILGLAAALAAGRFIESLLYGVRPGDPAHLGIAVAVLAAATAVAAYLPARRAARLDPLAALREE